MIILDSGFRRNDGIGINQRSLNSTFFARQILLILKIERAAAAKSVAIDLWCRIRHYCRHEHTRKTPRPDANNPRDWRIDDLKSVATRFGIDWRNEGGSHHVFSFSGVEEDVCVPAHRPVKPVYVRQFVALVDKAKELQS